MVYAYDPRGMEKLEELGLCHGVTFAKSPLEAAREAEALILATEWKEFNRVDLMETRRVMQTPIIFDGRNFFHPQTMKEVGFQYYGIGR
jgi:UDPglucose 6-dehydrogenase